MGGFSEIFMISVLITAQDLASRVFRTMGITAGTVYGTMAMGALAVGAGIAAVGGASIAAATSFNQAMGKINALTATSQTQMQQYQDAILQMAPALDQSPTALAQGLYFVISAGHQGADALNILKLSAQAAAATMTPMASVTDLVTTAMNSYRLQNLSAGHAMDDLINVVTQGKVTMSSLATSFGFVAVQASVAGISFDQASAMVANLSQIAGEHGSRRIMMDLGNAIRGVGIETEKVTARAEKMQGLSAPWDAAKFAAMDFMQKLQYIATETGGVGYLDKTQALAYEATGNMQNLAQATAHANTNFMSLVGGAAAFIPVAMMLSDKGTEYTKILGTMGGQGQETAAAFVKMRDTTGQQMNMVKVMGETVLTEIGLHILPYVNLFLMGIYHIGDALSTWLSKASNIQSLKQSLEGIAVVVSAILVPALITLMMKASPIVLVISGIIALGIAIGPKVQPVLAFVTSHVWLLHAALGAVSAIMAILAALRVIAFVQQLMSLMFVIIPLIALTIQWAIALLALPITWIVLGIVALGVAIALLITHWKQVVAAVQDVAAHWSQLVVLFQDGARIIKDVVTGNFSDLVAASKQFVTDVQGIFQQHQQTRQQQQLAAHAQSLAEQQRFYAAELSALQQQHNKLEAAYSKAHTPQEKATIKGKLAQNEHAQAAAKQHIATTAKAHAQIIDQLHRLADQAKGPIQHFADNVAGGIHSGFEAAKQHAGQAWDAIKGGAQAAGGHILDAIKWPYEHNYYVKAFVDTQVKAWNQMVANIKTAWNNAIAWLAGAWEHIKTAAATAWGWVHDHIVGPVQDAIGNVLSFIGGLADKIGTAVHDHVIKPIQDKFTDLLNSATTWGTNLIQNFIKGFQQQLGNLGNGLHIVGQKIADVLGFHSPTKEGPGRDADTWAPNLIRMYASGITASLPLLSAAAQRAASTLSLGLLGATGGAASAGSAALGPTIASVSSLSSTTINAHFPNATDSGAIQQALTGLMADRDRQMARSTRRAGYGGGLRAGLSAIG